MTHPPRKSHAGMIVGIVAAALLVLGSGGVGLYYLFSGDDHEPAAAGNLRAPVAMPTYALPAPDDWNVNELEDPSAADPEDPPEALDVDRGDPLEVATAYVDVVNAQDEDAAGRLTCDVGATGGQLVNVERGEAEGISIIGELEQSGDSATVPIAYDPNADKKTLLRARLDGNWCIWL